MKQQHTSILSEKWVNYLYQFLYIGIYSWIAYAIPPHEWNTFQIPATLIIFITVCVLFETWATLYQANVWAYEYESKYGNLPHFGCLDNLFGIMAVSIRILFPLMFMGLALKALNLPTNGVFLAIMMLIFIGKEIYVFYRLKSPHPIKPQTKWVILTNLLLLCLQIIYTYTTISLFMSERDFQVVLNGDWGKIILQTLVLLMLFLFLFLPYRLIQIYKEVIFLKTPTDYVVYTLSWLLIISTCLSPAYKFAPRNTWDKWETSLQEAQTTHTFICKTCHFDTPLTYKSVSSLCAIPNLERISFQNIPFFILPTCVFKLPKLKEIDFGNKMTKSYTLSTDIEAYGQAKTLEIWVMKSYADSLFPFQLSHLPNLKILKIGTPQKFDYNARDKWIQNLKQFTALKELYLNDTSESRKFEEELKIKLPLLTVKWTD